MLNVRGRAADACSVESVMSDVSSTAPVTFLGILEADMCRQDSASIQTEPYDLDLTPNTTVHRFQLIRGHSIKVLHRQTEGLHMIRELTGHDRYVSSAIREELQVSPKPPIK